MRPDRKIQSAAFYVIAAWMFICLVLAAAAVAKTIMTVI